MIKITFSPPYASRIYVLFFLVVKSIDLPSLLNLISQTSAMSPPTKNVSNGPYKSESESNSNLLSKKENSNLKHKKDSKHIVCIQANNLVI